MKILVCSKISIPAKDRTLPAWEYLRSMGHEVIVDHPNTLNTPPDAIISMGVTIMGETFQALDRFPGVPLFCYNWDCYEWVWNNPRPGEYDYRLYGKLLSKATEIWVPSECTGLRTTQWWGLKNWHTILSACPWWDCEDVRDDGYALCTLREIPDPYWGKFERFCDELKIPYQMTKHEYDYEDYQDKVAHCRFLVSPLFELSTGGLTLMEGYYLGKPCLLSNSPYHGGADYMGNRARYFQHDNDESFKFNLLDMYHKPIELDREKCKDWVARNYSDERMINDIVGRIQTFIS